MVAETQISPPPAKKPVYGPANPIPLAVCLAVRSFYVIQGLKPSQIAPMVGLSPAQITQLAIRKGWSSERVAKRKERSRKAEQAQDTRAKAEVSQIHEAIAMRTEELAVKTADRCADILGNVAGIDDKALQMSSGALRNFVQVARMSRGMDSRGPQNSPGGNGAQAGATLIFVGALERASKPEAKQADAVIDMPPTLPA